MSGWAEFQTSVATRLCELVFEWVPKDEGSNLGKVQFLTLMDGKQTWPSILVPKGGGISGFQEIRIGRNFLPGKALVAICHPEPDLVLGWRQIMRRIFPNWILKLRVWSLMTCWLGKPAVFSGLWQYQRHFVGDRGSRLPYSTFVFVFVSFITNMKEIQQGNLLG